MTHRFYCPELVESGSVSLDETEAHHLSHVLRHQVNDVVELFDGRGLVSSCQVSTIHKRHVTLQVISARRDAAPAISLTLATAVPKGDRLDWLIEKATELGVSRLVPLTTSRSVVDPRDGKLEKLRQSVVAACKQSGRNHLMEITTVKRWAEFWKELSPNQQVIVAHPDGEPLDTAIMTTNCSVVAVIGPEGGFSDEEIQSAVNAGAKIIQLGKTILRMETAALVMAAKLLV